MYPVTTIRAISRPLLQHVMGNVLGRLTVRLGSRGNVINSAYSSVDRGFLDVMTFSAAGRPLKERRQHHLR
jgi:hypothetical protein